MQVVDVEASVVVYVLIQNEYLAVGAALVGIVIRAFCLKERRLPFLYPLGFNGIAGRYESFLMPNDSKFCAKNLVKLLHSGSSQGNRMVLPRNTSGLYSR